MHRSNRRPRPDRPVVALLGGSKFASFVPVSLCGSVFGVRPIHASLSRRGFDPSVVAFRLSVEVSANRLTRLVTPRIQVSIGTHNPLQSTQLHHAAQFLLSRLRRYRISAAQREAANSSLHRCIRRTYGAADTAEKRALLRIRVSDERAGDRAILDFSATPSRTRAELVRDAACRHPKKDEAHTSDSGRNQPHGSSKFSVRQFCRDSVRVALSHGRL